MEVDVNTNEKLEHLLTHLRSSSNEVVQDQAISISNLFMSLYRMRPDVEAAFDINTEPGRRGFIDWIFRYGYSEMFSHLVSGEITGSEKPSDFGVNAVGYSKGELGLGEDIRMTCRALMSAGIPISVFPISANNGLPEMDQSLVAYERATLPHPISIFNMPPMMQFGLLYRHGGSIFKDRYNIGFWAWELERWPVKANHCYELVSEIWTISHFVKNSFSEAVGIPIHVMPQTVIVPDPVPFKFLDYGINANNFKFLFSFDFNSSTRRKNPEGCIKAFKLAFVGNENASLVIKVMVGNESKPEWKALLKEIDGDPRITVINKVMSRAEAFSLISSADCFVSLHRSEGFGRGIAEAMAYKKPCIVTNYSGNTDFCNDDNSYLVNYDRVELKENDYPFMLGEVNYWAEPSVEHAALQMRRVLENTDERNKKGIRAFETIHAMYSPEVTSKAYSRRLYELKQKW